jgi:DNA adenine methylase
VMYLGGKARIARHLSGVILATVPTRESYWEPFVGGANMFQVMAPRFAHAVGSDIHPDLIEMWQAVARGWLPPSEVSEAEYRAFKSAVHFSPERAFAGFACSYGGKWFGGYARVGEKPGKRCGSFASSGHRVIAKMAPNIKHAEFYCADFRELIPRAGSVIYCDPPYADTTKYGVGDFHQGELVDAAWRWSESGCHVFVSEYKFPAGELVWERETDRSVGGHARAVERLYYLKGN